MYIKKAAPANMSREGIDVGFLGSWNDDIRHAVGRGTIVDIETERVLITEWTDYGEPLDTSTTVPTGVVTVEMDA